METGDGQRGVINREWPGIALEPKPFAPP